VSRGADAIMRIVVDVARHHRPAQMQQLARGRTRPPLAAGWRTS